MSLSDRRPDYATAHAARPADPTSVSNPPMTRVSVVIANYNYARFFGAAIDSALALRWPEVEVVVVDDGSTDGSRDVIAGYGDRIRAILTSNASQRVAANRGFAASTGDVVVFLDSDDVLPPDLPERLAEVWTPAVSKAQFRMQRIDVAGRPVGTPFPELRSVPSPATLRHWVERTSACPTPPGSGNAYARWFLDRILPVGPQLGNASDSAPLAAAPLFGDVVVVPGVLVGYRQHGANDSNLLSDRKRFPREVERARARWRFASAASGRSGLDVDERPLFRSRELLQLRVASRRLEPEARPLPGDGRSRTLADILLSPLHPRSRARAPAACDSVLVSGHTDGPDARGPATHRDALRRAAVTTPRMDGPEPP